MDTKPHDFQNAGLVSIKKLHTAWTKTLSIWLNRYTRNAKIVLSTDNSVCLRCPLSQRSRFSALKAHCEETETGCGVLVGGPRLLCSDITNTLVGISGETGSVARISCVIECTVLPPGEWWF